MTSCLRQSYGLQCSRRQVAQYLRAADPEATNNRKGKRLVRPNNIDVILHLKLNSDCLTAVNLQIH